jgi:Zinc-binding dehydrogenase
MRAVVYRSVGVPEVIEVAEIDPAGAGNVRDPDQSRRRGPQPGRCGRLEWPVPAPPDGSHFGLGWDVAGTVEAVGPGAAWELGTPVIAIVQGATGVVSAQAEYAIVPSNAIAIAPAGVDAAHAATIPLNGLTATQSVELLGLSTGQSVFITGAAGAVGGYAEQLAKRRGLKMIASDRVDAEEFVTTVLGADAFVPSTDDPTAAMRQLYPNGVDALLDTTTLGSRIIGAVTDGGTFVTTGWMPCPSPSAASGLADPGLSRRRDAHDPVRPCVYGCTGASSCPDLPAGAGGPGPRPPGRRWPQRSTRPHHPVNLQRNRRPLAGVLAVSQRPLAGVAFGEPASAAAWKTKPSWGSIASADHTINPDVKRFGYQRAGTAAIEIDSSHLVMLSHLNEVADLIRTGITATAD